jgi:methyl-accepting chemotaxis protein
MFFSKAVKNNHFEDHAKLAALDKSQATIEFNLDGTIITANQNFLSVMGYGLDEVKGKHHGIFVDSAYRESPEYAGFWDQLRAGKFQSAQFKRITKSGKEVWIEASYNPILDAEEKPFKVVKYATDITAVKLRNAEFEGKINAISRSQAVIEFELDGTIITANENFLNVMGYRLDEIQGKHHSMFAEGQYSASTDYRIFWDNLRAGKFQAGQFKRLAKGHKEVWIEASYNPIYDMNGKVFKIVKFATDISNTVEKIMSIKSDMHKIENAVATVDRQTTSASAASTQTSLNVQTVASGAEELHASVVEISQTMTKTAGAADDAYQKILETDAETKKLLDAAQAMSGIVSLIQKIAEQVNLLSLNATIEAARAGEAGKGFAVVASEVKGLATQVAEATKKIGGEINNVQDVVSTVAKGLQLIMSAISNARGYVSGVAGAIEEQSAVARDMSENMQSASLATDDVSKSLGEVVIALEDVKTAVGQTKLAADNIMK